MADFGDEYFEASEDGDYKVVEKRKKNLGRYKRVLDSKSDEEALVGTLYISLFPYSLHIWIEFCIDICSFAFRLISQNGNRRMDNLGLGIHGNNMLPLAHYSGSVPTGLMP